MVIIRAMIIRNRVMNVVNIFSIYPQNDHAVAKI